jgi:predicted RNase H-like HicB family nuclease
MKYIVVLERSDNGYSAYAPDLPGCVAAGDSFEETEQLMREAIAEHVELLRERGETIPEPASRTTLVEVA